MSNRRSIKEFLPDNAEAKMRVDGFDQYAWVFIYSIPINNVRILINVRVVMD